MEAISCNDSAERIRLTHSAQRSRNRISKNGLCDLVVIDFKLPRFNLRSDLVEKFYIGGFIGFFRCCDRSGHVNLNAGRWGGPLR